MKHFTEAVKRNQEKHEGMHVFPTRKDVNPADREPIDLIAIDQHGRVTLIRARNGGHGHLNRITLMRLQALGKKCGARVLYSHLNGSNEVVFEIIYKPH